MLAKFGLIVSIAVMGAALFLLGVLAPADMRTTIATKINQVVSEIGSLRKTAPAQQQKPAQVAAAADKAPTEIPYSQLVLPTPLPPTGQYALQLGLYPTVDAADRWVQRVEAQGLTVKSISVLDPTGEHWVAVVVGEYATPDAARDARIALSRELQLVQALPVVLLPPPPAK